MSTFFSFLGTFLLSLLVATLVAQSFAEFFHSGEEFIGVLILLPIFTAIGIAAFGAACAIGSLRAIAWTAFGLAAVASALILIVGIVLPIAVRPAEPISMNPEDLAVVLELLVPTLIAIVIQWGLVRRRWLRLRGLQDVSRWPWIATIVACVIVFNPSSLAVLSSSIQYAPASWLRGFFAMMLAGGGAALIAMAAIEYYVRGRILRGRPSVT